MRERTKIISLGLLAGLSMLLAGCARTVTPIVSYGDQMAVTVTMRGTIDNAGTRYYLVMSDNPGYRLPLPDPYIIEATPQFIEPDISPQVGSQEAYFSSFFSTWSGYVVLDTSGYTLVKGPFVQGQTLSREVLSGPGEITNKIYFSFRLERLFPVVPNYIYFDFVTVPLNASAPPQKQKIPVDHLPSTGNSISKYSGSSVTISDDINNSLPAGQDIVDIKVEVQ